MKIKRNLAISDSGFIFNPSTGDSYSINPIGQEILEMMKEEKSDEEIKIEILNKYNTDQSTIEKDLYDFKNLLNRYKLAAENE